MKSASEYKADQRAQKRAKGLRPFEVWLHPEEWLIVKRLIDRLVKRRLK